MTDEVIDDAEAPAAGSVPAFPIIGVGASAGGIDALRRMLPEISPTCGMAFVVVVHLDPDHESVLSDILSRACRLPVLTARDGMPIEDNNVYVIPANATLTVQDGILRLSPPPMRGLASAVDEFLVSLAADRAENVACVILSGTGSDGTLGLRAIKESGGLTIAQKAAEYDGMMRSAVSTGLVDFVLEAPEIPDRIASYFRHLVELNRRQPLTDRHLSDHDYLSQVYALLRKQTGNDFSDYKDRTVIRRVQRRMHVLQIDDVTQFLERLRRDPHEVTLLFHDLLIGVTNFFRDPDAFAAVERDVVPNLFRNKNGDASVRLWVPGCSTGEEAYSLAILLREHAMQMATPPRVQIFASDIDDHALEVARLGRYPAAVAKDVSPARLDRYFVREDGTYRVAAELREMCLFSSHNLLRDAPFSRLDMISCRNLLIYLNGSLQSRIIPLFHYALNPNAFLFLGTSENVTRHSRLFSTVDKTHRVFQRRAHLDRSLPDFPLTAPDATRRRPANRIYRQPAMEPSLRTAAERQILDRFAPAFVVVNSEGDLLQSSGRTGKYLELPPGVPDTNIYNLARTGLRIDLRAVVHKAINTGEMAVQTKVMVGTNGGRQELDLYVQPLILAGNDDPLYLVVFQDNGALKPQADSEAEGAALDAGGESIRQLEADLRSTRERLQTTTEELESSNEELKSSNEELSSINEELQSSNEELETSKEELQSINEELQTVNAELNARVEELSRANNDMTNLLESTQIATVFLDRSLLVKGFTPAAKDVFRLVESDTGRPIMHVRPLFDQDSLKDDAERVLRTLGTIERQVVSGETGTRYVMRMLPYRTADNVISGVVMTFTDITRITAAEARIEELTRALQARVRDLEALLDLIPVGVMVTQAPRDEAVVVNHHGARLLGMADGHTGLQPISSGWKMLEGSRELPREEQPLQRAIRTGQPASLLEARLVGDGGREVDVMISATPLLDDATGVRGGIAAIVDITPHKRSEAAQRILLAELQHRVKNILATVTSLTTRIGRVSGSVEDFLGALLPRLSAMARMHDQLSSGAWQSVDLRSLLTTALDLYSNTGHANVTLGGDAVELSPNMAPTLGMVFYELATNAAKYGALSMDSGVVTVDWTVSAAPRWLRLIWQERGGPPVTSDIIEGFGSTFMRRSVEYDLDGKLTVDRRETGLVCQIDIPLAAGG